MIRWWCCLTVSDVIYSHSSHHTKHAIDIFAQTIRTWAFSIQILTFCLCWFGLRWTMNEFAVQILVLYTHRLTGTGTATIIFQNRSRDSCVRTSICRLSCLRWWWWWWDVNRCKMKRKLRSVLVRILQQIKNNRLNWNGQCTICIQSFVLPSRSHINLYIVTANKAMKFRVFFSFSFSFGHLIFPVHSVIRYRRRHSGVSVWVGLWAVCEAIR